TAPLATLSPTLMRTSTTLPAADEGTSMLALSDSSTISDCSCSTVSPALTSTSMTSTASKSPISGTWTSITLMFCSSRTRPASDAGRAIVIGCSVASDVAQSHHLHLDRACRIGNQAHDLRGLVGIVLVFLGVDEILVLEFFMHLEEGPEDVVARAQPAILAQPGQQAAHDREVRGGTGQRHEAVTHREHLL